MPAGSGRLAEWFQKRRESRIVGLSQAHLTLTTACVHRMVSAVKAYAEKRETAHEFIKELDKTEAEADQLKKEITIELSKGALEPAAREDLLNLVKGADRIADDAHDCGRIVSILDFLKLTDHARRVLIEMSAAVADCANNLKDGVSVLMQSPLEALAFADKVDEAEAVADLHYYDGLVELSKLETGGLYAGQISLYSSLVSMLEDTADSCQDMADLLRIVVIRRT